MNYLSFPIADLYHHCWYCGNNIIYEQLPVYSELKCQYCNVSFVFYLQVYNELDGCVDNFIFDSLEILRPNMEIRAHSNGDINIRILSIDSGQFSIPPGFKMPKFSAFECSISEFLNKVNMLIMFS